MSAWVSSVSWSASRAARRVTSRACSSAIRRISWARWPRLAKSACSACSDAWSRLSSSSWFWVTNASQRRLSWSNSVRVAAGVPVHDLALVALANDRELLRVGRVFEPGCGHSKLPKYGADK